MGLMTAHRLGHAGIAPTVHHYRCGPETDRPAPAPPLLITIQSPATGSAKNPIVMLPAERMAGIRPAWRPTPAVVGDAVTAITPGRRIRPTIGDRNAGTSPQRGTHGGPQRLGRT